MNKGDKTLTKAERDNARAALAGLIEKLPPGQCYAPETRANIETILRALSLPEPVPVVHGCIWQGPDFAIRWE